MFATNQNSKRSKGSTRVTISGARYKALQAPSAATASARAVVLAGEIKYLRGPAGQGYTTARTRLLRTARSSHPHAVLH